MDELITQVGVGGILAILILREVLPFTRNGKARTNGIARGEFERLKENVRYRDTCDKIHDAIQRQHNEVREDLREIKSLIRNGHDD